MTIWMKVSEDKYEYPEVICDTAVELAEKVGCSVNNIYSCISKSRRDGHNTFYKKVEIEDDSDRG